jgi:hypothetical protein
MKIDENETARDAMECFRKNCNKKGEDLLKDFLNDVKQSGQDYCSCKEKCRYHGKCMQCVIIHRGHGDHLPECFYNMINKKIGVLSELTEHSFKKSTENE